MDASIWDQILTRIETKVNRHSFNTWFRPTSFIADAGHAITVRVPNILFKDWLTKHYSLVLNEALTEARRPGVSLLFVAEGAPLPVVAAPTRRAVRRRQLKGRAGGRPSACPRTRAHDGSSSRCQETPDKRAAFS